VLALTVFNTPQERLTRFLYNDSGAELTVPALLARGLRPTVDFGYIYGLLPLLTGRVWYALLGGPSPSGFRLAALACALLTAWGLARLLAALRVGPVGVALVVLAMPDLLQSSTIVLVHALEPALLVHALAFQARGRRDRALALATADLFVKPAMAGLYGLLLLTAVALDRADRARPARVLAPTVVTGAALAAALAAVYGLVPLAHTLVPGGGLEVYRQNGYGFFRGAGRAFWLLPGGTLRDYLRYEVGAWLTGSAVLTAGGLAALLNLARHRGDRAEEVVATCAALHAGFVTLFFGNRVSWAYYYVILVAGLAAMAARPRPWWGWRALAVGLVAALTLVGGKVKFETTARLWRADTPSAGTFGLWASPAESEEWLTVLALCRTHGPAALLARVEGGAVLAPSVFEPPETAYLVPGHPVPSEITRKARQIDRAATVVRVRPRGDPARGGYERWPEIAAALEGFETVWEGDLFEVARRRSNPGRVTPR
jgi:hypothetical protein